MRRPLVFCAWCTYALITDGFVTIIQRPVRIKSAPVTPPVTPPVGQKLPQSDDPVTQSTDPVTAPVGTKSGPSRDHVTPQVTPHDKNLSPNVLQEFSSILYTITAQVTAQVAAQVAACCENQPKSAKEIMAVVGIKHWKTFQSNYLLPLIAAGLIERTIPDKPTSRLQKYRLTEKGRQLLKGTP